MAEFTIHDNNLQFNGQRYFRVGSQSFRIGVIGEKRTPLGKGNYLDVSDGLKDGSVKVRKTGPIQVDVQRSSKAGFLANFKALKLFDIGSAEAAWERMVSRELVLCYVEADERALVRAINDRPRLLDSLRRWGRDARIGNAAFFALKAVTAKSFVASESAEAEFTAHGLTVRPEVQAQQSGQTSIELPPEAVVAYAMGIPEWSDKNPKDGSRLVGIKPDWQGL